MVRQYLLWPHGDHIVFAGGWNCFLLVFVVGGLLEILFVLPRLHPVGPVNVIYALSQGLATEGVQSTFLTILAERSGKPSLVPEAVINMRYKSSIAAVRDCAKIFTKIKSMNPDLIHSTSFLSDFLCACYKLTNGTVPILTTIHCDMKEDYKLRYGTLLGSLLYNVHKRLLRQFDHVVYVSEHLLQKYRSYNHNSSAITNGVDTGIGARGLRTVSDRANVVVVGHLISLKNPLRILELVDAALLHEAVELRFLGEGPLMSEIISFAKKRDIKAVCMGKVSDVTPHLRWATIYVSASHTEGCPLAALEALGAGLSLVLIDIPAHREIYQASQSSVYLYDAKSVESFKNAVLAACKDVIPSQEAMGLHAKKYSVRAMSCSYLSIYNDLLSCN